MLSHITPRGYFGPARAGVINSVAIYNLTGAR